MTAFVDDLVAQVLTLEVALHAARERLAARTDGEALHDMRIAVRKLRSLLRPLRGRPMMDSLEQAASAFGGRSGPLRDAEVLCAELLRLEQADLLPPRGHALQTGYQQLLGGAELNLLLQMLDRWPELCRQTQRDGELQGARREVSKLLRKQARKLGEALADPAHDRHRLRLLIKRVRYGDEAYPQLSTLGKREQALLKAAQSALGEWHDLLQWLVQAERHVDLRELTPLWQQAMLEAERRADEACEALVEHFPT
ncbi:CHAD domain-containing protein [Pseudomonas sp. UL073]|uniref:CHAD domain-containing protein n=1 Tax=Zestomonas insulae TaxID=2809017 RepID=A0ABS2IGG0_9GAMM|nr:CHAD domain-containing protein [Pseudomonas insulae]MBM7062156.1 CHAD domain-containing protein [Pseudomonas insulae]